jgi:hypothetical protein
MVHYEKEFSCESLSSQMSHSLPIVDLEQDLFSSIFSEFEASRRKSALNLKFHLLRCHPIISPVFYNSYILVID